MKLSIPSSFACLIISCLASTSDDHIDRDYERRLKRTKSNKCTIQVVDHLEIVPGSMGDDEFTFECQLNEIDGGQTLPIEATKTQKKLFKKLLERGDLTPGVSSLNYGAGNAVYNNAKFYIPSELDVEKSTKRGKGGKGTKNKSDEDKLKKISRRLASGGVMGDKPVLAVRVIDVNGKAYPHDASTMSDKIFGTGNDKVNLKSQLFACSHGKLNIVHDGIEWESHVPVQHRAAPGVIEVTISLDITRSKRSDIKDAVTAEVENKLDLNLPGPFAQVMYMLEGCYGDECGWAAYAYINSWMSVYQGKYYYMPGVLLHELGHNFGFAHSGGIDGSTYSDHTCLMGNPLYSDETGKMCFNPAKNWQLSTGGTYNWYGDRKVLIKPPLTNTNGSFMYTIDMVGISDYSNNPMELPVVAKLETGTANDYFIGFNRATGANSQNDEADNEVVIVRSGANGEAYSQSYLMAHLVQNESFTIDNFGGSTQAVTITASKIDVSVDPAIASIMISSDGPPPPPPSAYNSIFVIISQDNYPTETSWDIKNKNGEMVRTGDVNGISDLILQDGQYTFSIYDSYGDGLCCGYGDGSYQLKVGAEVIRSGGKFESIETTEFAVLNEENPQAPTTVPPTMAPTESPTDSPTKSPNSHPSTRPSETISSSPSQSTNKPSLKPTVVESNEPSLSASNVPTTLMPTLFESNEPSLVPSNAPQPVLDPTTFETSNPMPVSFQMPSESPTKTPSSFPSQKPSTQAPTSFQDFIEVTIFTDNYPRETSWSLFDASENILLEGDNYRTKGDSYTDSIYVNDWRGLTFKIEDKAGDGICCQYGTGSYSIKVNGVIVLDGGVFGGSEEKKLDPTWHCRHGTETFQGENVCKCSSSEKRVLVDVVTDRYPLETSWTVSTCNEVEVYSSSTYVDSLTKYSETFCISEFEAHRFIIHDSYGDGICCNYGSGSYKITIDGKETVSSDGRFSRIETADINGECPSAAAVDTPRDEALDIDFECEIFTKRRKCSKSENCQWKGKRRSGVCEPRPKVNEQKGQQCQYCRSSGEPCCGTCVRKGPREERGCFS